MKRLALLSVLLAVVGSAGATASQENKEEAKKVGNECVFIRTVGNYQPIDRDKVVIWAPGRRDAYLAELSMPLFGLKSAWNMAMIDRDMDGRLCGFSSDRIGVRDVGHPESATIVSMRRLDAEQLAALEEKYDVSLTRKKKDAKEPS